MSGDGVIIFSVNDYFGAYMMVCSLDDNGFL